MLHVACSVVTVSHVAANNAACCMLCRNSVARCSQRLFALPQRRHVPDSTLRVTTDELCAAIRAGFNDTRTIFEPAGACPAPTTSGAGLSGNGAKWEWAGVCQRRTLTNSRGGSGGYSRMHSLCGHGGFEWAGALALAGVVKYAQQVLRPHPPISPSHAHTHARTHTRARTHTHAHTQARTGTHTQAHTDAHAYTEARAHAHISAHISAHVRLLRCK